MTVPMEYREASRDFDRFMEDLKAVSMLKTSHQAYTMLQAVFQVFRRRLAIEEAIVFASALPPVLRAIFVSDWNTAEERRTFASQASMIVEVMALRHNHNVSTETSISDVATALARHVDRAAFERVLDCLPEGAKAFWLSSCRA